MSDKFFFKGRKTPKPKHESFGYNTKRSAKPGTLERPFELTVTSSERQAEIAALLQSQKLHGNITVDASAVENIAELDGYLNRLLQQLSLKSLDVMTHVAAAVVRNSSVAVASHLPVYKTLWENTSR